MSEGSHVLDEVRQAFADATRPEHFHLYDHCEECAEHDETLRSYTPDTIGLEQLGNPCWDPICGVSDQGFHYYMPALARLSLEMGDESYLDQFLSHLEPDRIATFDARQRAAVLHLLEFIRESVESEWEAWRLIKVFERCIKRLRA